MTVFAALARATYKSNARDATALFFTFAFPLMFLIIFGLIFQGQQVEGTDNSNIDLIGPGVLSWGLANSAVFGVAFTLVQWRNDDLLRLIRLTPARVSDIVFARFAFAVVVAVAQSLLFIGVAMLPPFNMSLNSRWPMALPVMVLAVMAFLCLGLIVGSIAKTPEAVAAISNCIVIPMAFLSGVFIPLELMPGWLNGVSYAMTLRYVDDGLVYALAGAGGLDNYWISLLALTGFTVAFGVVGLRIFKWSDER